MRGGGGDLTKKQRIRKRGKNTFTHKIKFTKLLLAIVLQQHQLIYL